ncbi:MAG: ABC transporter permease [Lachnospiraceae bacterium]|nr:ABC transporter permease [Lachnospiraceae bacterium]
MKNADRKPHTMLKLTLREIWTTFGRFFAVFAIIALGTGFFSGVRITTPVMINSVDKYYRDNSFYDYRAVSTLGWEDKDVQSLAGESEIRTAKGAWQADALCETQDGENGVFKVHSITPGINTVQLLEGRMPSSADECLLDTRNRMGLKIGDGIHLSKDNDPDTLELFSSTSFTVTGFVESPLYINFERGTTSIGNGTVMGFLYVPEEAFDEDYYTEIYMKLDSDPVLYSDEYVEQMDALRPGWEEKIQTAADDRYQRLYDDANAELANGRREFEEKKADGERELRDAEKELSDGKKELDDAEAELLDGKKKLDEGAKELEDGEKELDKAARDLADGKEELDSNGDTLQEAWDLLESSLRQLDEGRQDLDENEGKLVDAGAQLDAARAELEAGREELDAARDQLLFYEEQLKASHEQLTAAGQQLSEAEKTLTETEAQLLAGEEQLANGKAQLDSVRDQLAGTNAAFEAASAELDSRQAELEFAMQMGMLDEESFALAQAEISAAREQIEAGRQEYEEGKAAYQAAFAEYEAKAAEIGAGWEAYEAGRAEYQAGKEEYEAGMAAYMQGVAEYEAGFEAYEAAEAEYESGFAEYESGLLEYEDGVAAFNQGVEEYNAGSEELGQGLADYYSGLAQYEQGVADYEDGKRAYEDAKAEYESGKRDYEKARADYEEGLADYQEGKKEYEDGLKEYEDGRKEFDEEIRKAEKELSDAEKELEELEKPDTFLLERNTNIGYACFETDSQIVEQVARILPFFFILVAVLVCMTTMTRMVDERRGQIGILKGLGYARRDIMMTFLAYSGSAAVLGCIVGYAAGIILFPSVIWKAYKMMYNEIPTRFMVDWKLAAAVFAVSIGATLGTTYFSCRSELAEPAASLMRPKAPKAGKRVFLEYIPAIWNRMKFMHKVSVRNIFRYKKRFFMMVVGISGCTALLVTGFGLKDSIATFVDAQYDDIQVAEVELLLEEMEDRSDSVDLPDDLREAFAASDASGFFFQQSSWDLTTENKVRGITLIVPLDWSSVDDFFRLRTMEGEALPPAGPGEALISISVAEHYGLDVGDEMLLRNDKMEEIRATVAGVFENHVYDYVFLSRETMEAAFGYYVNGAYVNFPEGTDLYEAQAKFAGCDSVISASVFLDFRERIANMMSSLNYVVLLIIMSAAMLAFVVLYNLTNINIIERTREIATVKVLGFLRRETSDYVFRENIFLTSIGMLAGLGLGVLMHGFVIDQIVVDLVYFRKEITPLSFLLSILLTFLFTFLVNRIMTVKLDGINMAESLKSVD